MLQVGQRGQLVDRVRDFREGADHLLLAELAHPAALGQRRSPRLVQQHDAMRRHLGDLVPQQRRMAEALQIGQGLLLLGRVFDRKSLQVIRPAHLAAGGLDLPDFAQRRRPE